MSTRRSSLLFRRNYFAFARKGKKEIEKEEKHKAREEAEVPETIDMAAVEQDYKEEVSKVSAKLAKMKFGVLSPEMIGAIPCHAYGEDSTIGELAQVTLKNDTTAMINVYDPGMLDEVKRVVSAH